MEKFEERECVVLENFGQKVFGVLHRPLKIEPVPAILMCHGFGGSKSGQNRHYVKLAQALSKEGIASLRIDFRGFGDSEGETKEATIEGQVSDAIIALEYLRSLPFVLPERLGILGRSLGGAIAVRTAYRFPHLASVALWTPLFSSLKWKQMWEALKDKPSELCKVKELKVFDGTLPNQEFLEQFFALKLEDDLGQLVQVPLLHIHAGDDEVIDGTHLDRYAQSRNTAQAPTRMLTIEHANHSISDPMHQQKAIAETVAWFKETL